MKRNLRQHLSLWVVAFNILASVITAALVAAPAHAIVPSGTYTYWGYPQGNYSDMQWSIKPGADPSPQPWFWAHNWWFLDQQNNWVSGGYAGLQTVGNPQGTKIAIFSIWDATGSSSPTPNSVCIPFGGEGEGYSCRIAYDWQVGHDYKFDVRLIDPVTWRAKVLDTTTNTETVIGDINVQPGWDRFADQSVNFTEYYGGELPTCQDMNYVRARFSRPTLANGTVPAQNDGDPVIGQNDCLDTSKVSKVPNATYHEMGIKQGITGDYHQNTTLSSLLFSRTDPTINFTWGKLGPGGGMPKQNYSVRWTGTFQSATTASHTFCAQYNNGVRLWVNGTQLINNWVSQGATEKCGTLSLIANEFYDVKMEYLQTTGSSKVGLLYRTPGMLLKRVVPQNMLRIK